MGRRTGGGGGGGRLASEILRRRIESCCEGRDSTVEQLVDYLRSNYPDYRRTKQQPFTRLVQQILNSAGKRTNKNPKRGHDAEENEHVKRRRQNDHDHPSTSSSSSSSSSEEEEEDGVSTLEDAVYGEKVEPKFDLMKSMLRDSYSESKTTKMKNEEKNIEFEVTPRKIDLVSGESGLVEMKKEESGKGGTVSEERKEGPRFRDLGGMESVLEELKMEVIVPLYHPQLPQWLGVRPMAGILLHGPPGCGKTKLAHAIANETGVPFYKISATEVVSGVSGMDFFSYACGLLAPLYVIGNPMKICEAKWYEYLALHV